MFLYNNTTILICRYLLDMHDHKWIYINIFHYTCAWHILLQSNDILELSVTVLLYFSNIIPWGYTYLQLCISLFQVPFGEAHGPCLLCCWLSQKHLGQYLMVALEWKSVQLLAHTSFPFPWGTHNIITKIISLILHNHVVRFDTEHMCHDCHMYQWYLC